MFHCNFWHWYSVFRRLVSSCRSCRYRCDLCWWWIFMLAPPLGGGWNDRWGSLPFDSPIVFPVMNRTRWQHPSSYWADVGAAVAYDKEVMSGGSVVCKGSQVGPPTQQFLFSERHIQKNSNVFYSGVHFKLREQEKEGHSHLECTKGKQEDMDVSLKIMFHLGNHTMAQPYQDFWWVMGQPMVWGVSGGY